MAQTVRGFRDIMEPDAAAFAELEARCRALFRLYGYGEIRLPTVEQRELFVKSTGDTTDIVEKEMYAFEDAGGRMLALRPEGTPGVARAYIENGLPAKDLRQKLFYIGSMFRAERPQAGRYREFEQIGAEYIGNPDPSADAETMVLLAALLKSAGVKEIRLEINSIGCPQCRPAYKQALLDYLKANLDSLCDNCKKRVERNPLRALDCKTDGPKLAAGAPPMKYCPDCDAHFAQVREHLKNAGLAFNVNPNLVRGLDYYTRTVFEFRAAGIGSQDAIAAGGRYDTLIKSMGGPDVAAVGWAMGADRVLAAAASGERAVPKPEVFVAAADKTAAPTAFQILQFLRGEGLRADAAAFSQSLKSQMRAANKSGARFAAIIGEREAAEGTVTLKDLAPGGQEKTVSPREAADLARRQLQDGLKAS